MSNNQPKGTGPILNDSAAFTHEQWKNDFLRVVLRFIIVVFTIAILSAFTSNTLFTNILYIVILASLALVTFTRVSYTVQAVVMLAAVYVTATNLLSLWGIEGEASLVYLAMIALTALLFERRVEFISLLLCSVTILVVAYLTVTGRHVLSGWIISSDLIPAVFPVELHADLIRLFSNFMVGTWIDWIVYLVDLLALSAVLIFAIRLLKSRFNIILAEAKTSLEELAKRGGQLEARVAERTVELDDAHQEASRRVSQLQTIAEVSESIAQLKDLNEFFSTTTTLISERFGFYHVGIFLIDEARQSAVLQASNSEGGQRMLGRAHSLKLGTGVVGFCAQNGRPRIALDVGADAVYFDNPDLPNTRSEVALPLKSRIRTIGVLDVQSTEPAAFTEDDLRVLTALANQVSIAMENARLLTEARTALAQVQEVHDEFTRAEWSRTISRAEQPGFRYHVGRIEMLENPLDLPEVASAVQSGQIEPSLDSGSTEKRTQVAVPVKIRGEVIGVIHVESNDSSRIWKDDEIRLVEAVAERAALAMENARLFQDARRRAAKEQAISQATTRISSAINMENILHTTAEELERVLGGSEVLIRFQNKERS